MIDRRSESQSRVPRVRRLAVAILGIAGIGAATVTAVVAQEVRPGQMQAVTSPAAAPARVGSASGLSPAARDAARAAIRPSQASAPGGLFLQGPVTATWGSSGVEMTVSQINNEFAPPGTAGQLGLALLATPVVPTLAADSLIATAGFPTGFHGLGSASIPNIPNGSAIYNVDTGLFSYVPPPAGCYFVSVALTQDVELLGTVFADFRTLSTGGEQDPGGSGYDLFSFGSASCDAAANGSCTPGATTLCLERYAGDRRFQITVAFSSAVDNVHGDGIPLPLTGLGVGDAGLFSFFGTQNPEMLVKVINACALNSRFWVFLAATTNLSFTLEVTDTVTGHKAVYHNNDQVPAQPVLDTNALACP